MKRRGGTADSPASPFSLLETTQLLRGCGRSAVRPDRSTKATTKGRAVVRALPLFWTDLRGDAGGATVQTSGTRAPAPERSRAIPVSRTGDRALPCGTS